MTTTELFQSIRNANPGKNVQVTETWAIGFGKDGHGLPIRNAEINGAVHAFVDGKQLAGSPAAPEFIARVNGLPVT